MEDKKIRIGCTLFLCLFLCMIWRGKIGTAAIFVEQAGSKAPNVKVYVQGNVNEKSEFKGKITGTDRNGNTSSIGLVQEGKTVRATDDDGAAKYIFLLDNSASVSEKHFEAVKTCLIDFRKRMEKRGSDRMSLYTVGVESAGQGKNTVLENVSGGGAASDIKKIQKIKRNGKKTVLYRAINEITGKPKASGERTVLIILTDGEDDSTGSKNNPETTLSNVKNAQIPVYGILLHYGLSGDGDQEKIQITKRILNTEGSNDRMVRGSDVSSSTGAGAVERAFDTLLGRIWEKTVIVKLKAGSNRTLTNTKLTITKTNGTKEDAKAVPISYSDYVSDKTPPKVSDITVQAENKLSFQISDENGLNKDSLLNQANYKLYRVKDGEKTEEAWGITKVQIPSAEDGDTKKTVEIITDRAFYNGEYVLKLSGLRDASEDSNIIDPMEKKFKVDKGAIEEKEATVTEEVKENLVQSYWWIAVIVLAVILALIVVIIILLKKNRSGGAAAGTEPGDLNRADRRLITLTVTDGKGFTKDLQWDVEGSFFVGRSDICEVFFEDDMLSKQHFVIEVTKMGCYIEDLGSMNGTYINGVRIRGRREISVGDEISAGREHFRVQSFQQSGQMFDPVGSTDPIR